MKRTFRLNKLVRDQIIELCKADGQELQYRTLIQPEFIVALKQKLVEEASELNRSDANVIEELADIQEVIDCLIEAVGADRGAISKVQSQKRHKKGSFKKRYYVETITVDGKWTQYYQDRSGEYPEVQ